MGRSISNQPKILQLMQELFDELKHGETTLPVSQINYCQKYGLSSNIFTALYTTEYLKKYTTGAGIVYKWTGSEPSEITAGIVWAEYNGKFTKFRNKANEVKRGELRRELVIAFKSQDTKKFMQAVKKV